MREDGFGGTFDLILSAETAYREDTTRSLVECIARTLSVTGEAVVATGARYFGCGGGVAALENEIGRIDRLCCEVAVVGRGRAVERGGTFCACFGRRGGAACVFWFCLSVTADVIVSWFASSVLDLRAEHSAALKRPYFRSGGARDCSRGGLTATRGDSSSRHRRENSSSKNVAHSIPSRSVVRPTWHINCTTNAVSSYRDDP